MTLLAAPGAHSLEGALIPFSPDENIPQGLDEVPGRLNQLVNQLAAMPAKAQGTGALLTLPQLPEMQAGLQAYQKSRETCIADQARASKFCREETNPELQGTLATVNLILAGANSLAINDSCKTMSKAVGVAQLGLTAYTGTCGALRAKCNLSCNTAGGGMKQMTGALVAMATPPCTLSPVPGTNPAACTIAQTETQGILEQIKAEIEKEAALKDKRSIHAKQVLCEKGYGFLLGSAALSMASMVSLAKQSKDCDDETKGAGPSSGGGGGAPQLSTAPAPSSTATPEPLKNEPEVVAPANANPNANANTESSAESQGSLTAEPVASQEESSELRAFLPGGERATASVPEVNPEVTSATGMSNFEKMNLRFKELGIDGNL